MTYDGRPEFLERLEIILTAVFGKLNWHPPSWILWSGSRVRAGARYVAADRRRVIGLAALLVAIAAAATWYRLRPRPHFVEYAVHEPELTQFDEKGVASIKPLLVSFSEPAAPLASLDKRLTTGIELTPAFAGTWSWVNDKTLRFTPKNDWPVDAEFTFRMAQKRFIAPPIELEDYRFRFRTKPFTARIAQSQFYQDPLNPSLKKLVANVAFSHAVDPAQFEQRITLIPAKDAEFLGLTQDSRRFTVIYDKLKLNAYIHSAALALPKDDTSITVSIGKGVRAARGGNETEEKLQTSVLVPGRTSLRFSGAQMTVVDNARYEPEQIALLTSSSPVAEKAFQGKTQFCLLPVRHPKQPAEDKAPYRWDDPAQIGNEILASCQAVNATYVASDGAAETQHGFKFQAPPGRYLYLLVKDGVQGTGGYLSGKPYIATIPVQPYPQALKFLGNGALLSLSGDRKAGFLVRDVDRVEVEVGRVLPNQLQHVAPQMWNYAKPDLSGVEDSLVERFTAIRDFRGKGPGKPSYDSIDLGQYLVDKSQNRRGLFLLHVRSAPPPEEKSRDDAGELDAGDNEQAAMPERAPRIEDTRLILVTDLGFIVKQNQDGSRDVFTQSIRTGEPVGGARIEIVGSNGLPVAAAVTDGTGRAQLAKLPELKGEKLPLLIVAQKDADMSFIPLRGLRSNLDFSRFDTGGVENAKTAQQLSAYLFSDRGIYRPGETTHLGMITRTADWKASLSGLPIDVEISDPRGAIVTRDTVKLSETAFDELAFTSQASAPTGTYQAVAWLKKDEKRRDMLGSVSFQVKEFEPDRLKVRLDLSDKTVPGWLTPAEVKARVSVAHLFGEPAGGRRVEGELSLTPVLPHFSRYADYRFQVGETLKEPFHDTLAATVTDDKGNAELNLDLKRFTGRAYRINVLARAFEAEGGRNVAAQNSAIVADAPYLVGVKTDGELSFVGRSTARSARWLAVNQQLEPVPAEQLTLDWVQRKYLSVLTEQGNKTFRYVSRLKEILRESHPVRIAAGGANLPLPTQEPGDFVLILRNAAGAELNRLSYSVAGEANLSRSLERNAELQVQLDRTSYAGGDTISVSIRAPYVGAGLITVERDRVYQHQWFRTSTTSSVQKITLPRGFEGNGYVGVQFLRDPASDEIFMSPLSYGVAAFSGDTTARSEALRLTAPHVVKPGAVLNMRVAPAEASRVAVLVVDEGILQVARYQNPDPLGFFFQKRMLQVQTTQILDLILPEFKRFLALAAPGGDADGGFSRHLNPFNRKHKAPVAWWSGIVDAGPGGRELHYTVPDYFNGRLRIVAIAVNPRRMGVAAAGTDVKGDFILTPNVPVMVTPGDEFSVSIGVFNNMAGGGPVKVQAQVSRELALVSPPQVDLQVAEKREGVAEFRFRANAALGPASLHFTASRGKAETRMEESVSVRPAVAYRTQLTLGRFNGASAAAPLTRDVYSEHRVVEAAISTIPLVWGEGLVAFLDTYPYPCTEQLVSKGFAALILASRPEFGKVKTRDADPIGSTVAMLQSRANAQGGFGLWSSSPETAEFPTVYAAHFLIEAKDRGQKVPPEMLASVDEWLVRFASTPAPTLPDARMRAYAVYLLARQGIKPAATLANVEQELSHRYDKSWPADLAAAYLASTYRLLQRNSDADRIIRGVTWSSQKRDWADDVYYQPSTHDFELLYLLARHFPDRLKGAPLPALDGSTVSSLSAAYTLLALDAYAKTASSKDKLSVSAAGKDGREQALLLPPGSMPKVSIPEGTANVRFGKDGSLPAFYSLNQSGFDRNPPASEMNQGLEVIHEFLDAKGNLTSRVKVGEEFQVRLRIRCTNRDRVNQVAIVDLLPGGVEPVLDQKAQQRMDARDDRVIFYVNARRDATTLTYGARATNPGVFQAPPAFAEAMYNRAITGMGAASRFEIVKP